MSKREKGIRVVDRLGFLVVAAAVVDSSTVRERERIGRDDPRPVTWSRARFPFRPRFRSIFGGTRSLQRQ